MSTANKLTYLNGTKQAIKQAINEDFEVIDNNTTFREYADEISSNNAKYKDLIPKETKNATNTLDISNSAGLDKALVTQYGNTSQETTSISGGDEYDSPSPDHPQPINVVSGNNTIIVSNSDNTQSQSYPISLDYTNLFKKQDISSDDLNRRLNQIGEYYDEIGYFISPFIKVDEDTKYTINYTPTAYTRICYYASNNANSFISRNDDISSFTTPSTCQYLRFCNLIADIDNIRLEKGSTITNNYIELCKIGNYKDRIYPLNGKWYLEKKIGKFTFNAITTGTFDTSGTYKFFKWGNVDSNGFISGLNVYCNYLIGAYNINDMKRKAQYNNSIYWGSSTCFMRVDDFETTEEYIDFINNHEIEVYARLKNPTTTEITENNYPTLYNQLNNIKLFEGVNHINMTNESGLDVEFDITYYKDWKLD